MKRGRIAYNGRTVWGSVVDEDFILGDGTRLRHASVQWLPPVTPGATIFALGLNYADHSAELGFKAPSKPLVFLKGPNTLIGHEARVPCPADATQMHPECELVAVIGRAARNVPAKDALNHIAGYTVTCDFAIRNYLENYYRPNLRVKNRDSTTPIGPWIVGADEVGDPQDLILTTHVNGETVQAGTTAQMVFPIAELVAYLSAFMTLMPGDMIMSGTPHGVRYVKPGDAVVCTIQNVGMLVSHIEAAA